MKTVIFLKVGGFYLIQASKSESNRVPEIMEVEILSIAENYFRYKHYSAKGTKESDWQEMSDYVFLVHLTEASMQGFSKDTKSKKDEIIDLIKAFKKIEKERADNGQVFPSTPYVPPHQPSNPWNLPTWPKTPYEYPEIWCGNFSK